MNKLDSARKSINDIDRKMAKLFCERMDAAKSVAEYKKEMGLPVYDRQREEAIVSANCGYIDNDEYKDYYVNFIRDVMRISRTYQHSILEGARVAYSGVEGAFAHIASGKIFPDAIRVSYPNFESAYESVVSGECDCAVLPIENSNAGEVGHVLDMIFSGSLHINGVYELSVSQNLVSTKDAKISDIKKVISHIQALEQCDAFIKKHGFEAQMSENTAIAAQFVSEKGDPNIAAIASEETAELYGLKILEKNINGNIQNTTRFAVLTRSEHIKTADRPDGHSVLVFTVKHEAGSLAKAINVIGKYGFNMRTLRSRSMKKLLWQYYFYVEIEGNVHTDKGQDMLKELSGFCDMLKVAGTFYDHTELN